MGMQCTITRPYSWNPGLWWYSYGYKRLSYSPLWAFQMVMGLFLSSVGASCQLIDTYYHIGICVSYHWVINGISNMHWVWYQTRTVQWALVSLSKSSWEGAINFIQNSEHLYMIVYFYIMKDCTATWQHYPQDQCNNSPCSLTPHEIYSHCIHCSIIWMGMEQKSQAS